MLIIDSSENESQATKFHVSSVFQIITDIDRLPYGWPFHMIGNDHSIAENSILGIESRLRYDHCD